MKRQVQSKIKNQLKKYISIILSLTLALLFTSCNDSSSKNKENQLDKTAKNGVESKTETKTDSKSDSQKKIQRIKDLIVVQGGEPETLDPHSGNKGTSLIVNRQIYSRLVKTDENMNILPDLAESWKSIDDQTMEFIIRKGVKFHSGDLLTLDDIVFSFERMKKSPRIAFIVPPIEKVEIVNENTIRIRTEQPFAPLLYHLAHPALGIVSGKTITASGDNYIVNGTGPYKYGEWVIGERVVLEKNDDYFLDPPNFEKLIFKSILEGTNRAIALETGEAHIAIDINPIDVKLIENNKNLKILKRVSNIQTYIGMNNLKGAFTDIRVRKAINYVIDKKAIIDVVLNGEGELGTSAISPGVFGFSDKIDNYPMDIDKSRTLLKEAGYEKGFKTTIIVQGGEIGKQTGEIVQSDLKKVGIEASIEVLDGGAYWARTSKGSQELYLASWGAVTGDADYGLYSLYHSSAVGTDGNRDFYNNPKVDDLLERGRKEINIEKRKELYNQVQEIIMSDSPNVIIYNKNLIIGTQKWVEGLNVGPVPFQDFYNVYQGSN